MADWGPSERQRGRAGRDLNAEGEDESGAKRGHFIAERLAHIVDVPWRRRGKRDDPAYKENPADAKMRASRDAAGPPPFILARLA